MILKKLGKSLAYRLASTKWRKLAIEVSFDSYHRTWVDLVEIGVKLNENEGQYLLQGYEYAKNLKIGNNAIFEMQEGKLYLYIDGVTLLINSAEELFIAYEIFVKKCYEFNLNSNAIVVDIGMNVGIASLYFASRPDIEKIFSFEPFKPTYKLALSNLEVNPGLRQKIRSFNYGLSGKSETLSVEYSEEYKGQVGIKGTELIKSDVADKKMEVLNLERSSDVLGKIISQRKDRSVIIKMDCEGAEFRIIPNLKEAGLLEKINLIMMEWHGDPNSIIESLKLEGFSLIRINHSRNIGMIYAFKS